MKTMAQSPSERQRKYRLRKKRELSKLKAIKNKYERLLKKEKNV